VGLEWLIGELQITKRLGAKFIIYTEGQLDIDMR
jgi:hypothetical protein